MGTSNSLETLPVVAGHSFSVTRKIRFGQTDSAGIVYYPNYFDMFNELVEDWFEDELGVSFRQLHKNDSLGVPTVHVECDFIAPCMLGEKITFSLRVLNMGRTSLNLQVVASGEDEVRLRANLTIVFVNLMTYRATEPSAELRERIANRIAPVSASK